MLWYPVGFTAGYLALLLFVAAPLRRSGAYTLPDFAEARLRSPRLRQLATVFVILIGWLYLVPQLQGAGLTLTTVTGAPYVGRRWSSAAVVTPTSSLGGMRSITFVQAFQYWLKLTALAVPACSCWSVHVRRPHAGPARAADVPAATTVAVAPTSCCRSPRRWRHATGEVDGARRTAPCLGAGRHTVTQAPR